MKRISLPAYFVMFLYALLFPRIGEGQVNIIQIVADDLGWADLSTGLTNQGNGSPYYQTPNIDALAQDGMSFTSFYAQPTCSPTRAALFTGQYAPRNGLHTVGNLNSGGDSTLLVGPTDGSSIKTEAVTLGETLQAAGYVTAHIGKFHCTAAPADIVASHGFDFNIGGTSSGGPSGSTPFFAQQNNAGTWSFGNSHGPELDVHAQPYTQQYIDDHLQPYANGNDPDTLLGTPKHLNDAMADATIDFLEDRVVDGESFFVNVAFNAVHVEINSRPDLEAKYNTLPASNVPEHDNPAYAGLLEGMDQAIGRVVDFVEQNGLGNDTLIVFMSDNGGTSNGTDNFPLQGGKGSFQEGGIRVPMIVYLPGTISAGVSNEALHPVDFYETYTSFANATLPDSAIHSIDGESFAGILTGEQTELNRDTIFYHFPGYVGANMPKSIAIHDGNDGNRYKLTYFYEDRNFEFYDLTNDIGETVDLVESGMTQTQFENAMNVRLALTNWLDDSGAELPTVRATGETVPLPLHSPAIKFALDDTNLGAGLDGLSDAMVSKVGLLMDLTAEGANGVFQTSSSGVGVNSDLDSGGNVMQQRIDGSLTTPEGIVVSFNEDVYLKHINVSALSGSGTESLQIQFVSGDNPFDGLNGYDTNGFSISSDALSFVRDDGSNSRLTVGLGRLAQDEILLTAGSEIRITANPVVGSGILLGSLGVALPAEAPATVIATRDGGSVLARPDLWSTLSIQFNTNVSLNASSLTLVNDTLSGAPVDLSGIQFEYDSTTLTATWTFDNLAALDAGYYTYILSGDSITVVDGGISLDADNDGSPGGDYVFQEYVALPGDANLDGDVDVSDFNSSTLTNEGDASLLLANLGTLSGATWAQGDFNGDGDVDVSQFDLASFTNLGDASTLLSRLGQDVTPP